MLTDDCEEDFQPMFISQKDDYQDKKNMTREEIIKHHMSEMEKRRKQEEQELILYLKDEDPESCINVLFVLSYQEETDETDKRAILMERLEVQKPFVVKAMLQVLNQNLNKFLYSVGLTRQ